MRSLKITDSTKFYSQEVLDFNHNILLRLYQLESGFGFRFISYLNGKEIDPIKNSEFTWVYGPMSKVEEAKSAAIDYYNTLVQK
jgi:hypothetical protein